MTITSSAESRPETVVGSQLVRTWDPEGEVQAEVVLIHGLAEHSGRYERLGSILALAGLRVTAPDLIGFGATGGTRAYVEDWSHYLDQVERLVQEARTTSHPVVLLGQSMGGLIALEYALSARSAPDLLVLSAPALSGGANWHRALAPLAGKLVPKATLANPISGDQLSRDPAVGEAYFADPLVNPKTTTRLGAELFAAVERTGAVLRRLDIPTYVIHGGADTIVSPAATVELGSLPGVERRLYPQLRHEAFNEPEGEAVAAEMVDWIKARL